MLITLLFLTYVKWHVRQDKIWSMHIFKVIQSHHWDSWSRMLGFLLKVFFTSPLSKNYITQWHHLASRWLTMRFSPHINQAPLGFLKQSWVSSRRNFAKSFFIYLKEVLRLLTLCSMFHKKILAEFALNLLPSAQRYYFSCLRGELLMFMLLETDVSHFLEALFPTHLSLVTWPLAFVFCSRKLLPVPFDSEYIYNSPWHTGFSCGSQK